MTARTKMLSALGALLLAGVTAGYSQTAQEGNPNYPARNPFFFEGKIDWELLKIDQPSTAWEYMQRGIYRQDDLENEEAAIEDYKKALDMNSLVNETCQLVTSVPDDFSTLTPPPCMFTLRLRLGYLLIHDDPEESVRLFKEVLVIDPMRLEVSFLIAEAYEIIADEAETEAEKIAAYEKAIEAGQAELALTPLTNSEGLSPDEANNAHVHWLMAKVYEKLERYDEAIGSFENYLKATRWHSDVLPWRIPLAEKKIAELTELKSGPSIPRRPARGRIR